MPMNNMLFEVLTEGKEGARSDHVVEWAEGQIASIRKGFTRAVRNAGLTGVGMYTLRHTAAVHMIETGAG